MLETSPSPQDSTRAYFQTRLVHDPARDQVWQHITNYLSPFWGDVSQGSVLELGTGYGSWIRSVRARERHALDINPDLEIFFKDAGIQNVKTQVGSAVDLKSYSTASLDLVLASNLLEHLTLDEAIQCTREVHRVLKPGGHFCIVQPNFKLCPREYFDDYTHRTIFTDVSLTDLFESVGLKVERAWRKFTPFSMKGSQGRLVFLVPYYLRSPWKPLAGQMCLLAQKRSN